MAIPSSGQSYLAKRPHRGTIPSTLSASAAATWRYFGWLVPGLLVLALLTLGWWRLAKARILAALPAIAETTTGNSAPPRADVVPLPDSDREIAVNDLVAEDPAWEIPAEFGTTIGDGEIKAQVLEGPAKDEAEAQALNGTPAPDDEPLHVVRPGENLSAIARQHGASVDSLLALNPMRDPDLLRVGQWLHLPPAETRSASPSATARHTVEPGEALLSLAVRYGASPWAIAIASDLRNPSLIYPGQQLLIPGQDGAPDGDPSQPHPAPAAEGKWIDVDLTAQRVVAYEGAQPVFSALVSTGLSGTPTVTGRYRIYLKFRSQTMYGGNRASGDYYYLPDVPYVQYFYQGYAFHGTYWHANFGQPMSRGCVNMRTDDARWLFEWAEPAAPAGQNQTWADGEHPGTLVVIHY